MSTYIAFTCRKAEASLLRELLAQLHPAVQAHGGRLVSPQGPQTGFPDPALGDLAEMRLIAFEAPPDAQALLDSASYCATQALRAKFSTLEVDLLPDR